MDISYGRPVANFKFEYSDPVFLGLEETLDSIESSSRDDDAWLTRVSFAITTCFSEVSSSNLASLYSSTFALE